ncbi:MAG: DNA polymerase IV [Deltaproteobacteria bacterium]|jgi:DNA polymerase-4/DNA polymerase V|nr:DNA polymerase IV [Deltaproteobacteria bacterium]MDA8299159.1 DNA polymerase IV [Deltaproteobacteria bacterium]
MTNFCVHSWPKAIAHIDADAFFVACERALNPSLNGKCVAVGKERGIITALSYEAKAKGVKRGMRSFEAKKICPGLIVIESDYEAYSLFSLRMFNIIKNFSPQVEEYSIDEAFVDLSGLRRVFSCSYEEIAKKMQIAVEKELSITVSIGVSITKTLAKIASKLKKPKGLAVIEGRDIQNILCNIKIEDVWGIGNNTAYLLKKFGINSALDFALKDENFIGRYLSKPYKETWLELRGNAVLGINASAKSTYKTISKAKSFYPPSSDEMFLFSELTKNLENACAKARRFNLAAAKISIFLKTQDFKTTGVQIKLTTPSAFPPLLMNALKEGFKYIYEKIYLYRQTEIVLYLTENVQYSLFDDIVKIDKIKRIYDSIDGINKKLGRNSVHLASSIPSLNAGHKIRFSMPLMDIKV